MNLPGKTKVKVPSPAMTATAERRFWAKVTKTETCWLWTAGTNGVGYGALSLSHDGAKVLAHRFSYEMNVGPIPAGYVIDHLCRVTLCVRPDHLEAVPQRLNNARGLSPSSQQAKQTACKHGHPFDPENTYVNPRTGKRSCRACHRAMELDRYRRRKAEQMGAA